METRYTKFVLVQTRPDTYHAKFQLLGFSEVRESTLVKKRLHWYSLFKTEYYEYKKVERGFPLVNTAAPETVRQNEFNYFVKIEDAEKVVAGYKEAYRKEDELKNFQTKVLKTWLV